MAEKQVAKKRKTRKKKEILDFLNEDNEELTKKETKTQRKKRF